MIAPGGRDDIPVIFDASLTPDKVAYVRFASVYREFKDAAQFLEELRPMLENRNGEGTREKASGVSN